MKASQLQQAGSGSGHASAVTAIAGATAVAAGTLVILANLGFLIALGLSFFAR